MAIGSLNSISSTIAFLIEGRIYSNYTVVSTKWCSQSNPRGIQCHKSGRIGFHCNIPLLIKFPQLKKGLFMVSRQVQHDLQCNEESSCQIKSITMLKKLENICCFSIFGFFYQSNNINY